MTTNPKKSRVEGPRPGRWPDEVPVLLSSDLSLTYESDDGRRDLAFWLAGTFDPGEPVTPAQNAAYDALLLVISERANRRHNSLWAFLEEARKRKSPGLAWQANCWNEAMRRLGYEVPQRRCQDPGLK